MSIEYTVFFWEITEVWLGGSDLKMVLVLRTPRNNMSSYSVCRGSVVNENKKSTELECLPWLKGASPRPTVTLGGEKCARAAVGMCLLEWTFYSGVRSAGSAQPPAARYRQGPPQLAPKVTILPGSPSRWTKSDRGAGSWLFPPNLGLP